MINPFTSGPIAPERNPPIHPEYYQPRRYIISAITLGPTTTITTTVAHDYVIGQLIRILIPVQYGSVQLNESEGFVLSIPAANQVVIDIDSSRNVNTFIGSPTYGPTLPQICAIGDVNTGQINANGPAHLTTFIPGSFINISPL